MACKLRLATGHLSTALTAGAWYRVSVEAEADTGDVVGYTVADGAGAYLWFTFPTSAAATYVGQFPARANEGELYCAGMGAGDTIWVDNYSVKQITFASMFALIETGVSQVNVKAAVTLPAGYPLSWGGVVSRVDSLDNPTNAVVAAVCGPDTSGIYRATLWKWVNGAITPLIAQVAVTYTPGGVLEIRQPASTTFQLWYDGVQAGTDRTISDATIISNTKHGLIATDSEVRLDDFFAVVP
jgi:hypothetical protein